MNDNAIITEIHLNSYKLLNNLKRKVDEYELIIDNLEDILKYIKKENRLLIREFQLALDEEIKQEPLKTKSEVVPILKNINLERLKELSKLIAITENGAEESLKLIAVLKGLNKSDLKHRVFKKASPKKQLELFLKEIV